MKAVKQLIEDVFVIEPLIFKDERGYLYESYNESNFQKLIGLNTTFMQDNHVHSKRGVFRGFHYQLPPKAQGKLIRVIKGEVLDIAIDIRQSSPTFGRYVKNVLSDSNKRQQWIPTGLAHGFITLSETSDVLYKVTSHYDKNHEHIIAWNHQIIEGLWDKDFRPILSLKDSQAKPDSEIEFFN